MSLLTLSCYVVTTSEQLQQFIPKLLAQVHVEALIHGNISQQVLCIVVPSEHYKKKEILLLETINLY